MLEKVHTSVLCESKINARGLLEFYDMVAIFLLRVVMVDGNNGAFSKKKRNKYPVDFTKSKAKDVASRSSKRECSAEVTQSLVGAESHSHFR